MAPDEPKPNGSFTRMERRTKTMVNALRALIRDSYAERFGAGYLPEDHELSFKVKVAPGEKWALEFDPPLHEQLWPQMDGLQAEKSAFQAGYVYCYRCEGTVCEHARPGSSLEVFAGYHQLGRPIWREFSQALLEAGDERIGLLYDERPKIVARMEKGRALKERQLAPFGKTSKTYALLAQVTGGYFRHLQREPLAASFQAVEIRDSRGLPSLELNTICYLDDHQTVSEALAPFDWVNRARKQARDSLKKIEESLRKSRSRDPLKRIPDVLRKLVSEVEKGYRQSERQTRHAKDRRQIRRPVDKAMADLSHARPERMFLDAKTKAVVVYADKGRCHIFNENGKHITSFVIQQEAVQLRLKKKRWSALGEERYHRFLQHFTNSIESES